MRCVNPKCGWTDEEFEKQFNDSLFRFFFRDGKFWLQCVQCDTEFRPSKTLNGLEVQR